jgi:O-antigen ligase
MSNSAQPMTASATSRLLWAATLLTLPVTSFRYFPGGEGTYVRPLAFYPLILLMLTLSWELVRGRTTFPRAGAFTPLAAFLMVAMVVSVLAMALAPVPMRGQDVVGRIIRAWAAVLIGILFFASASWMNRNETDMRFSVKWLFAGLVLDLLWSGLQGATFYLHILPKPLVTHWQRAFSLRELIRTNRISGLAYEPSWLAGQISTLYVPWLLAALLTGERQTRFRWLEPLLLTLTIGLLLATFSRGGVLAAAISAMLTVLLVGRGQIGGAWRWFLAGLARGRGWFWRLGVVAIALALMAGGLLFLGQKGYVARLWNTRAAGIEDFLIQNSAGARAAYAWGAMHAFLDHPWTGVGLGASGFYIYAGLPDWALTTVPEIARQLSPESPLYPNPKNLYVRLLAETGLIGFFLFISFQLTLLGDALTALTRGITTRRFVGIASISTWLALMVYNMTQDSFATPNLWINLGVLAGLSGLTLKSLEAGQPA